MSLADQFNKFDVSFDLTEEGVYLEACEGNEADLAKFEEEVLDNCEAYVKYHPLDRRAGLVVFAKSREGDIVWYDLSSESAWVNY